MSELSKNILAKKNYLLIGNPNVGKSSIFNLLSNSTSTVSNIDRMTTKHTEGQIKHLPKMYLVDLPGIYNLDHPLDEEVEVNYRLIKTKFESIINVINAFTIKRDMLLTLQCAETGMLNSIVVNMTDTVNFKKINLNLFKQKIGNPNIITTTNNKEKIKLIKESIMLKKTANDKVVSYPQNIEDLIKKISIYIPDKIYSLSKRFFSLMLLENNSFFWETIQSYNPQNAEIIKKIIGDNDYATTIFETRKEVVEQILNDCGFNDPNYVKKNIEKQNKFDHFILKKWIGLPLFVVLILSIYYLSFGSYAGGGLQNKITYYLTEQLNNSLIKTGLENIGTNPYFISFLCDGILNSIFTIVTFLIPISILYFFISTIQQIGLLSRISILLDNSLEKFGLSGRSIINIFTGFGCSVPAIMIARSSSSKKERIISILIIPFITCTTKVIVISTIINEYYSNWSWLLIYGLIVSSSIIALIIGLCFSKILFRKQQSFFCIEMVQWNNIIIRQVLKNVWSQVKVFIKKTILVITLANIVIWMFLHIGPNGLVDNENIANSFLASISKYISYIFWPCFGTNDWKLTCSLIAGFPAKEIVLTTMGQININLSNNYPLIIGFIIFFMFYAPCLPTIAIIKNEIGWKNLFINFSTSFFIAYSLSTIVYWATYLAIK